MSALGGVCSGEWGDVCSRGVSALGVSTLGGVCSGGCLLGGCQLLGGVYSGGCLLWGVVSQHAVLRQTPPSYEQNDKQVQKYYLGHNFVAAGNSFVAFKLHRKDSVDYLTLVCQEWILLSDKLIVNSLARMDKQKY